MDAGGGGGCRGFLWRGERTRVAVVGVGFGGAFGDFEVVFVAHLVEGAFGAAEEFAGVAVAGRG